MRRRGDIAWTNAILYHADPAKLPKTPDELCEPRKTFKVMTDDQMLAAIKAAATAGSPEE